MKPTFLSLFALLGAFLWLTGCGGGGGGTVTVVPNTMVQGRFMRGDTNDPVKGATVNAYTTRSRVLGSVLATTTTDDTGAYILHFAAHGDTNIIIIADPAAESGLAQIELSMAVSAGATISGNVTLQRPAIVSNVGVTTTGTMTRVGANISATAHTVESDGEVYDGTATLTPVL